MTNKFQFFYMHVYLVDIIYFIRLFGYANIFQFIIYLPQSLPFFNYNNIRSLIRSIWISCVYREYKWNLWLSTIFRHSYTIKKVSIFIFHSFIHSFVHTVMNTLSFTLDCFYLFKRCQLMCVSFASVFEMQNFLFE